VDCIDSGRRAGGRGRGRVRAEPAFRTDGHRSDARSSRPFVAADLLHRGSHFARCVPREGGGSGPVPDAVRGSLPDHRGRVHPDASGGACGRTGRQGGVRRGDHRPGAGHAGSPPGVPAADRGQLEHVHRDHGGGLGVLEYLRRRLLQDAAEESARDRLVDASAGDVRRRAFGWTVLPRRTRARAHRHRGDAHHGWPAQPGPGEATERGGQAEPRTPPGGVDRSTSLGRSGGRGPFHKPWAIWGLCWGERSTWTTARPDPRHDHAATANHAV